MDVTGTRWDSFGDSCCQTGSEILRDADAAGPLMPVPFGDDVVVGNVMHVGERAPDFTGRSRDRRPIRSTCFAKGPRTRLSHQIQVRPLSSDRARPMSV